MKLIDANVLLYAVNQSAPQHTPARRWMDDALNGSEPVGFAWVVLGQGVASVASRTA